MLAFVLGLLGVLATIGGFILVVYIFTLWKLRFYHPARAKSIKGEEVPSEVATQLEPVIRELQKLGFQEHFFLDNPDSSLCDDGGYRIILLHNEQKIAAVANYKMLAGKISLSVGYYSFLESGKFLMTSNVPACDIGRPEHFNIQTGAYRDAGEQFDAHFTALLTSDSKPILLDQKTAFLGILQHDADELDFLEEQKIVSPDEKNGPHTYRIRLLKLPILAVVSLFQSLRGNGKSLFSNWCYDLEKSTSTWQLKSQEVEDVRWELDGDMISDFRAYESQKKQAEQGLGLGRFGKTIVFLISLLAAVLWLKWLGTFGWTEVASIVVILVVHELGHSLTMRAFGYKNLSIFFIPFLGAAATGKKRLASAWEEYWVLMMGPLPGFLAGFVILIVGYFLPNTPVWLLNAASLSLIINGFNFLPFSFLDGGRMLDLVVFRRMPRIRFFLMIASSIGGVILALILAAPGMLTFSVLGLVGLRHQRKLPLLVPFARANLDREMSLNEASITAMRVIREAECNEIFGKPSWHQQVDELVDWSLSKQMGVFGTFSALGMHGLMLALPLAGVVGLGLWLSTLFSGGLDFARYEEAANWRDRAVPEHVVSQKGTEFLVALEQEPALYAHYPQSDDQDDWEEEDWENWEEEDWEEYQEPVFVRKESQPALTLIHSIPSWREAAAWRGDFYGNSEVVRVSTELLYLSAEDWHQKGESFKSLKDLAVLFKISDYCHPNNTSEEFREWLDFQNKSVVLLEDIAKETELSYAHRDWFARKLASSISVAPESLVAMGIEDEVGDQLLSLFGGLGEEDFDETTSDGAAIQMLYGAVRNLKKESTTTFTTKPEDDYETLQQLASNRWEASLDLKVVHASTRKLADSVMKTQESRVLLSQRLQKSLAQPGKVRLESESQPMVKSVRQDEDAAKQLSANSEA